MPSARSVDRETTPPGPGPARRAGQDAPPLPPPSAILAVGAGGVIGAAARVGLVQRFPNHAEGVPWTTLAENAVGAFLLGLALVAILQRWNKRPNLRPFLATGVLGSFTTFSNYTVEIVTRPSLGVAVVYAVLSVALGLAAAAIGITLGRRLFPPRRTSFADRNSPEASP